MIDVDLTSNLHNRTGKFFVGRDIVAAIEDLVVDRFYWRIRGDAPPVKSLHARAIGRLSSCEAALRLRTQQLDAIVPRARSDRPTLHTDPLSVLHKRVSNRDIVICHDTGPLSHPDLFARTVVDIYNLCYRAVAASKPRMVFVSKTMQQEFHQRFGTDFAHSEVIYPQLRNELNGPVKPSVDVPPAFLLSVGAVGARKNQLRCIRAYAASGLAADGVAYVICGSREPGHELVAAAARETRGVSLMPYVTDGELSWLYQHARGFVLPSLLEGFGVPVAEAMANGLVPLVGRGTVLEEVAGEGALFVDPYDLTEIAAAMRRVADMNDDERQRRRSALSRRLEAFSSVRFRAAWRDLVVNAEERRPA